MTHTYDKWCLERKQTAGMSQLNIQWWKTKKSNKSQKTEFQTVVQVQTERWKNQVWSKKFADLKIFCPEIFADSSQQNNKS